MMIALKVRKNESGFHPYALGEPSVFSEVGKAMESLLLLGAFISMALASYVTSPALVIT